MDANGAPAVRKKVEKIGDEQTRLVSQLKLKVSWPFSTPGVRHLSMHHISCLFAQQITFAKRKNLLLKKAMELSVLCDCEVGLIVFNPSGGLLQYSSQPQMDRLLVRYSKACQEPHERRSNKDVSGDWVRDVTLPVVFCNSEHFRYSWQLLNSPR